jgi:uncharacterized membrane protein
MAIMQGLTNVGYCLLMSVIQVCEVAACTAGISGLIGLCIILNPLVWISYYIYTKIRNDNQRLEWEKEKFERDKNDYLQEKSSKR